MEVNTLGDSKMAKNMDKELLLFYPVETNTLEKLKMVNYTGKGLSRGHMEVNTSENLKMVINTDKGLG